MNEIPLIDEDYIDDIMNYNKINDVNTKLNDVNTMVIKNRDNRYFIEQKLYFNVKINNYCKHKLTTYFQDESFYSSGNDFIQKYTYYPYIDKENIKAHYIYMKIMYQNTDVLYNISNVTENNYYDNDIHQIFILYDEFNTKSAIIENTLNKYIKETCKTQINNISEKTFFSVYGYVDDYGECISIYSKEDIKFKLEFDIIDKNDNKQEYNNNIYKLDKIYNNIKSIKVIDMNIKFSDTIINKYNDTIKFKIYKVNTYLEEDELYIDWKIFYIEHYNYTIKELCEYIERELNTICDMKLFEICVSLSNIIEIKIINMNYKFEFEFIETITSQRSLHNMLGFKNNKTEFPTYIFTNQFIINNGKNLYYKTYKHLNFEISNYMFMTINDIENLYDVHTQKYYFNKLNKFNNNNFIQYQTYIQYNFQTILKKLEFLKINFYDSTGQLYNFNNDDNSIVLEITYFIDKLVGTDISSNRNADNISGTISYPVNI